ncbi:ATP-grasp domain-containing protein [Saccharothrix violaceirubra]|uniref:ATP-grasp domain-containing protein n=1 Tax=Saccharothrix violaceirubra TaxID=413306 RepID=UPI001C86A0EC
MPDTDVELSAIGPLVAGLRLPFVTADLVLRDDGVWRVVELGDGQVGDRPRTMDAEAFIDMPIP